METQGNSVYIIIALVILYIVLKISAAHKKRKRNEYISLYSFPLRLSSKISATYPHLKVKEIALVIIALREYFNICNIAKMEMVSMPSKVVDIAWHEFIISTREYKKFCHSGFGEFLHHTPTSAMRSKSLAETGLKRAWYLACRGQDINPRSPTKIPLLFSIDFDLAIPDGNNFVLEGILQSNINDSGIHNVVDIDCLGDSASGASCEGGGGDGGCGGCGGGD